MQHLRTRYDNSSGIAGALLLCALIGAEVLALMVLAPSTIDVVRDPAQHGFGDFPHFYENAQSLSFGNTYNPALAFVMHPLTYLAMDDAFRVYLALNMAAMLAIALIAQRGVESPLARVAVVLGFLALPQAHWALRTGHFTELLSFAALLGFMLCTKRPVLAGLCFAVLALKMQYLAVPLLYLLWTRNWRAFGATTGALAALSIGGIAALSVRQGSFAGGYYIERASLVAADVVLGRSDLLLPVQQSWQYSWSGFLISAGLEPNPLVVGMLLGLSAAIVAAAWVRCDDMTARAAAAAGMMLLAPYATFYNWAMLAVAGALLLHATRASRVRPSWLTPAILVGVAAAAVASQNATPFPTQNALAPAATRGLYWIQPAVLLSVAALAIAGRPSEATGGVRRRISFSIAPRTFALGGAAACAMVAGFYAAAFVSRSGPFEPASYFGRGAVVRALPADFPAPPASAISDAGEGSTFPYRVEWRAEGSVSDVAGAMSRRLADGSWTITGVIDERDGSATRLRAGRQASGDAPAVAVDVTVARDDGGGTTISVEFAPIPVTLVRGYDEWLRNRGLIVTNVSPEDYDKIR